MPDNNDTTNGAAGTPPADASTDATAAGSGQPDEVSLWRSRFNGQTAKVTELTKAQEQTNARISDLEKQLTAAQASTASADEAAKALVAAAQAELANERSARRLDGLKARFPETFTLLGDAAAGLTEENLAANEARLTGGATAGSTEPPTPLRHNESKTSGGATGKAKQESAADIKARLESMPSPW